MINYTFCLYFHNCDTDRPWPFLRHFRTTARLVLWTSIEFKSNPAGFKPKNFLFGAEALSLQSSSIFWAEFERPGHFHARNSIEFKKIWFVTDFSIIFF